MLYQYSEGKAKGTVAHFTEMMKKEKQWAQGWARDEGWRNVVVRSPPQH